MELARRSSDTADDGSLYPLIRYRLPGPPDAMYYIPNFITAEEETNITNSIPPNKWTSLSYRRLQAVPCALTRTNTLLASPLPKWLVEPIVPRIQSLDPGGVFTGSPHGINHCLINEYLPGHGIMPHEDGGAYYPVVATVSLGGSVVLDVRQKRDAPEAQTWRILQEPRSLLLTTGSAYTEMLHGIAEVESDEDMRAETVANWWDLDEGTKEGIKRNGGCSQRTTRISLTFRDVLKVSNLGSKIFGRPK